MLISTTKTTNATHLLHLTSWMLSKPRYILLTSGSFWMKKSDRSRVFWNLAGNLFRLLGLVGVGWIYLLKIMLIFVPLLLCYTSSGTMTGQARACNYSYYQGRIQDLVWGGGEIRQGDLRVLLLLSQMFMAGP